MAKFYGQITDGKLVLDRAVFGAEVRRLGKGNVSVELKKVTKKDIRSNNQNNYYWGAVVSEFTRQNYQCPVDMHRWLKVKFLLPKITGKPSQMDKMSVEDINKIEPFLTTTNLKKDEWEELMREIRAWASTEGIYIDAPGEETLM